MHHNEVLNIDDLVDTEPFKASKILTPLMWLFVLVGVVTALFGVFGNNSVHFWGAYYTNLVFWMGLAVGMVVTSSIFQIVRATWAPPVRRIAEASVSFLPTVYALFLLSYFGKDVLFPWGSKPMPGREWWMQPEFVYARFAVLFFVLFWLLNRFVRLSLRGDIGLIRERSKKKGRWSGWVYDDLSRDWQGFDKEVSKIQPKLSWNAPVIIIVYAIVYSLFAFEMIMGMDTVWYSNLFGAFNFIGNLYIAWAALSLTVMFLAKNNPEYAAVVRSAQLWDLGKLTLGFCMLWGYMFFSQFLPQWYGNLPEETQWLILRTREYPWKAIGWATFGLSFIIPFILLFSEDVKRVTVTFSAVCLIVLSGVWLEKYIVIMPQLIPGSIPFSFMEIGLFIGFLGIYVLSVQRFLTKYPFIQISHPLTYGKTDW